MNQKKEPFRFKMPDFKIPDWKTPDWKFMFGFFVFLAILILVVSGKATPKKVNIFGIELEFTSPSATPVPATQTQQSTATTTVVDIQPTTAVTTIPAAKASEPAPVVTTSTPDASEWNGVLTVRKPTLNEIRQDMLSIWDANNLTLGDIPEPGELSLEGTAAVGHEYLWPIHWCANNQKNLQVDIDNITTIFTVNGRTVPDKYILDYDFDANTGWKCNYRALIISDWLSNTQYTLQVERIFKTSIDDGQQEYPAGSYIYKLVLTVP